MARKPRDYKAEYARRKELHKGDTFKARGHGSSRKERIERQVRRMNATRAIWEAPIKPAEVYRLGRERGWDIVEAAIELQTRMQDAYQEGDVETAHNLWVERNPDLPDWLFHYHGFFS
jgi:hypothetical protein